MTEGYDEDGAVVGSKICDRPAVVVFSKPNPRQREPDQPSILRYPRCRMHDGEKARQAAGLQGFEIEEVTEG